MISQSQKKSKSANPVGLEDVTKRIMLEFEQNGAMTYKQIIHEVGIPQRRANDVLNGWLFFKIGKHY